MSLSSSNAAPQSHSPRVHWTEEGSERSAQWRSERGAAPPKRLLVVDDSITADRAYRLICEGTSLLWRGDFHNGKQLLQALARRVDKRPKRYRRKRTVAADAAAPRDLSFHQVRQQRSRRAQLLNSLLIPLAEDNRIALRRAPDTRQACREAWGATPDGPAVISLSEMLGIVGAHEWRKKGVEIPSLGDAPNRIYPHYGVFSPVRGEYVDLVAREPLPHTETTPRVAFDIGTGSGVLAAVLARRSADHRPIERIVATDLDPRSLACAKDNIERLQLTSRVDVVEADLFPDGRACLAVCNPPWLPARPGSPLERAVYDENSRMLRGFLNGLRDHLVPGGEGWLILSDLAEHLELRSRADLLQAFERAGLRVAGRTDTQPTHGKALDADDPLHRARSREVTSLWRLAVQAP